MDEFQLLEDTVRRQATKYWGKYRGSVTDTDDPDNRGRIKVLVPSVFGDNESQWAEPAFPYGGGKGFGWIAVPPVDSAVLVEFIEGDASAPVWTAAFWRVADEVAAGARDQGDELKRSQSSVQAVTKGRRWRPFSLRRAVRRLAFRRSSPRRGRDLRSSRRRCARQ